MGVAGKNNQQQPLALAGGFGCSDSDKTRRCSCVGAGLADDFASLLGPNLWPEYVLPCWEQYYRGITTGPRSAHVENLCADHVPLIRRAGITNFDPSISPRLSPRIIRERFEGRFCWRLPSFEIPYMSIDQVRRWVFNAARDGASAAVTIIEENVCDDVNRPKIDAFVTAARRIQASARSPKELEDA